MAEQNTYNKELNSQCSYHHSEEAEQGGRRGNLPPQIIKFIYLAKYLCVCLKSIPNGKPSELPIIDGSF